MKRKLFSGDVCCNANCLYCFAKWQDKGAKHALFEIEKLIDLDDDSIVVYPCCDGDFFQQNVSLKNLSKLTNKKIYVSISTKHSISDEQLKELKLLDNELRKEKKGFIKISVSFTNKYMIDEIENGTMSYQERINLLKKLQELEINTSVIIKPILPFIPFSEYKEIVDDLSFITKFVLGDLYVDLNTNFYKKYIENKYEVSSRKVNWLNVPKNWYVIEDTQKKEKIHDYIKDISCESYESDIELILSYIR